MGENTQIGWYTFARLGGGTYDHKYTHTHTHTHTHIDANMQQLSAGFQNKGINHHYTHTQTQHTGGPGGCCTCGTHQRDTLKLWRSLCCCWHSNQGQVSEAVCARDEEARPPPRTTGRGNHKQQDRIDSAKVKDGDASSHQQAAAVQIMFNKLFLNASAESCDTMAGVTPPPYIVWWYSLNKRLTEVIMEMSIKAIIFI